MEATDVSAGHYARWRDDHDVVHWVESQLNDRVYTSCSVLVEVLKRRKTPSFLATRLPPTCVICVCDAIPDVYENVY